MKKNKENLEREMLVEEYKLGKEYYDKLLKEAKKENQKYQ